MPVQVSQVTHNNNAHFYRIAIDIAKEGAEVWDLTPYFKGRVGDDNFGLQIVWYYQGRLLDVTNKTPYIKGNVGHYSFDDKKNLQMAPDADVVTSHGNPNDCQANGQVTYYFPQQMFMTDGIFKGFIGLQDDNQNLTGVDIWFRVLPGVARMGHACDVYVDILDKTIADFKEKIRQQSIDFDAALQQELQKEKDLIQQKLDAAGDAIDTDKATLEKIAAAAGNIEAQITAQDIVKRQEFTEWVKQMQNSLGKIGPQISYYPNEGAMKIANPSGTTSLCITVDNNHAWLYANGSWQDCGSTVDDGFTAARDFSQDAMFGQNILQWEKIGNTIVPATEDWAHWEDKPLMHLSSSSDNTDYVILRSKVVPAKASNISLQFPALIKGMQAGDAHIEINQFTDSDNPNDQSTGWGKNSLIYSIDNTSLSMFTRQAIPLNKETTRLRVQFVIDKGKHGDLYVGQPMLNYGNRTLSYSPYTLEQKIDRLHAADNVNILCDLALSDFTPSNNLTVSDVSNGMVNLKNSQQASYSSPFINVKSGATVSLQAPANVKSGDVWIFVQEYEDELGSKYIKQHGFQFGKGYSLAKFDSFTLDQKARCISVSLTLYPNSEVDFGMPTLNYGSELIPYDFRSIKQKNDNNLIASSFMFDTSQNIFAVNQDGQLQFNTVNHHAKYPEVNFTHINLKQSVLSLQLPYQNSGPGPIYVQLVYSPSNVNQMYYLWPNDDLTLRQIENIKVPEGSTSVALKIWPTDMTTGIIGVPKLNYGQTCITYNEENARLDKLQAKAVIPRLYISGMSNAFDKIVPFDFVKQTGTTSGYISYNVQGNSSRNYPKINFKVKLFADPQGQEKLNLKLKPSWVADSKYNIKANWIDATQARNIVNANLITEATAITPLEKPELTKSLLKAPQLGQMDGFPIEVYFNGDYYGLCTFNLKKADKSFGMDSDNPKHEVISVEKSSDAFSDPAATVDGKDYGTEIHDTASETLKSNFTKFVDFVNNSSDDDFKAHLQDYIDVHSVINEMLFGAFSVEYDYYAKSILLATWNEGSYFYMIPYDLDSTWDLDWHGNKLNESDIWFNMTLSLTDDKRAGAVGKYANGNKLLGRVFTLFKPEIKQQGIRLRQSVWSTSNILANFKQFINRIPEDVYEKEHKRWPALPSVGITDYAQIQRSVIERSNDIDNFLEKLS